MNWLTRFFGIEQREPSPGVQKAGQRWFIGSIFEADAARQAAGWEATKREINRRRRPVSDNWLRQGEPPSRDDGRFRPV